MSEILAAWRGWVDNVPEECESIGRMLQLPDFPFLPDHLRGRSFVLVELAFIGSESDGAALVQPFRDLGPKNDRDCVDRRNPHGGRATHDEVSSEVGLLCAGVPQCLTNRPSWAGMVWPSIVQALVVALA